MNKRWYDADPVITNAINLIQKADNKTKKLMADFIIKEAQNLGVEIEKSKFDCFWHRRFDENSEYFTVLEYLKALDSEARREVSFKIITKFKNTSQT